LEVWPNLEIYVHGGVSFKPYKEQFKQLVGGDIAYRETYNASEGFFGVQDKEDEDMALMLDYGIFYEFIPMSEYYTEEPQAIWIDEVELGVNYIAQQVCKCEVSDFTVAPVYLEGKSKGRHQWAIEFITEPSDIMEFESVLDEQLAECNSDYEAKRSGNLVLDKLEIVNCRQGTFYSWLKANHKLGGQHKIPKLCNDRKIIEEIIAIHKNE